VDLNLYLYMLEISDQLEVLSYFSPDILLNSLVKNALPALLFWALWLLPNEDKAVIRQKLITTLFLAATAIFVGRTANMALPYKLRPMYDPTVAQNPVVNVDLSGWSAFPSDHAALFFSLAACFLWINRFAGTIILLHAVFIVSIPRIFYTPHRYS